jgi:membrane-associated protease RseP (regulator of RpoE activity)
MDTATIVMIILCIIYVPIWVWVWRRPEQAARLHLVKYGPTVMIKTRLGINAMEKIGKYRRFWLVFGFVSKFISALLFFTMMYMLLLSIINLPARIGQGGIGIQYALAIPGFNPMLPLTYGVFALFVAMIVHEMGHGIQSRANNCTVDSTGLLYGVVPLGAFCEPNEEELKKLPRRPQMDIYSAGISVNTFVAIISIALMLLLCSAVTPASFGQSVDDSDLPGVYYIDAKSPAYESGVPTSALILGIKETGEESFHTVTAETSGTMVRLDSDIDISPLNTYVLKYTLEDGADHESGPMQMGALIKAVTNNSPASKAGLQPLTYLYTISITSAGSETVVNYVDSILSFKALMATTHPGDIAQVTTASISDGGVIETVTHDPVTLTSSGSQGYLGISVSDSGFTFTTPSLMMESATNPFYNCTTPFSYVENFLRYLSGPFNGLDPIPNSITWWYDTPAGDTTWILIKTLYWLFWLDILLAISNALPAYPFDGGFLFEGGINWLLEKLGKKDEEERKKLSGSASNSVSTVVLVMFFLVLLAFVI